MSGHQMEYVNLRKKQAFLAAIIQNKQQEGDAVTTFLVFKLWRSALIEFQPPAKLLLQTDVFLLQHVAYLSRMSSFYALSVLYKLSVFTMV